MKKIEQKITSDSIDSRGNRITSYLLTYPRFIHAELMTHRMFSRNSASSRAIPFEKMVKMVEEDPFIPIAWQKDHKGMQGTEYYTPDEIKKLGLVEHWLDAKDFAIHRATSLNKIGVTKQLCNRLLEPYMWHTVLVTATEWDNFFELRCPKYHSPVDKYFLHKSKKDCIAAHSNPENLKLMDKFTIEEWLGINESQAEIHIQALAEAMWDARNESKPKLLEPGEWHIPFGDDMDLDSTTDKSPLEILAKKINYTSMAYSQDMEVLAIKIAIARCARLSYLTFDNKVDYEKDIELHDRLLESKHMSPFEHCAKVMTDEEYCSFIKGKIDIEEYNFDNEDGFPNYANLAGITIESDSVGWCNNFKGFIPYRYLIENNIK